MNEKEQTIEEFFEKNQAVINGVGVFVVLAELSRSYITIPVWARLLSFLFLGLAIFLTIELIRKSSKEVTDSLYLFRAFFIITIFIFTLYWFLVNLDIMSYIFLGCLAGLLSAGLLIGYKRLRYKNKWRSHI
jgi:heme/copper-type cytochrome/quinol oxidase subunit 4